MSLKVAIVGLGRVGSEFLEQMESHKKDGVNIVAVAELSETPGKQKAKEKGYQIRTLEDIITMGNEVDILFDLTGNSGVRKKMREMLAAAANTHTVIAPETFAYLVWTIATNKPLPDVHSHKGY